MCLRPHFFVCVLFVAMADPGEYQRPGIHIPQDADPIGDIPDSDLLSLPHMVQAMLSGNMAMRTRFDTPGVVYRGGSNRQDTKVGVKMAGCMVRYFFDTPSSRDRLVYIMRVHRDSEIEFLLVPDVHNSMRCANDRQLGFAQACLQKGLDNQHENGGFYFHMCFFGSESGCLARHYLISIPTRLVELFESKLGWEVSRRWDFMRRLTQMCANRGCFKPITTPGHFHLPCTRDAAAVLTHATKFCYMCQHPEDPPEQRRHLKKCSRCLTYYFCSEECMLSSWSRGHSHREFCHRVPDDYVPCLLGHLGDVHSTNV